jgi:hypothetical protein
MSNPVLARRSRGGVLTLRLLLYITVNRKQIVYSLSVFDEA